MKKISQMFSKIKPNEKWSANIFFFSILAYLVWTGYVAFLKRSGVAFGPNLAVMLVPVFLLDGIKTLIESIPTKKDISAKEDISKVTVVIPTYNGANHISATIKDLLRRFEPSRIIISSNGSTDRTCEIAKSFGVTVYETKEPIGKVGAINVALKLVKTPYVLIMDDDTLVGDALLPTSELVAGRGGVAFTVLPIKNGFLSELQSHEYRKSMEVGARYHNSSATVQNISGAIGLFNTQELVRQIELHSGEFSGEDLQRTLLVHLASEKLNGVVMSSSVVKTLAPSDIKTLFKQRVYGWNPGFLANFHLYVKLLFMKNIPLKLRFEAFYGTFVLTVLDPIRLLSLPILIFEPVYLLFFYITYFLLELVTYLRIGRNEPIWVIFIFPVYGIFNFITRILAMSVFFYRRFTKVLGRGLKNDDYRFMQTHTRALGALSASVFVLFISALYASFLIVTSSYESVVELPVNEYLAVEVTEKINTEVQIHLDTEIKVIAISGDSRWSLSEKIIKEYASTHNIEMNSINLNGATRKVFYYLDGSKVKPGDIRSISSAIVEEAVTLN